jgi:hypothetical protein
MSSKEPSASGEPTDETPEIKTGSARIDPKTSRPYWSPNEGDKPN